MPNPLSWVSMRCTVAAFFILDSSRQNCVDVYLLSKHSADSNPNVAEESLIAIKFEPVGSRNKIVPNSCRRNTVEVPCTLWAVLYELKTLCEGQRDSDH